MCHGKHPCVLNYQMDSGRKGWKNEMQQQHTSSAYTLDNIPANMKRKVLTQFKNFFQIPLSKTPLVQAQNPQILQGPSLTSISPGSISKLKDSQGNTKNSTGLRVQAHEHKYAELEPNPSQVRQFLIRMHTLVTLVHARTHPRGEKTLVCKPHQSSPCFLSN